MTPGEFREQSAELIRASREIAAVLEVWSALVKLDSWVGRNSRRGYEIRSYFDAGAPTRRHEVVVMTEKGTLRQIKQVDATASIAGLIEDTLDATKTYTGLRADDGDEGAGTAK